MDKAIGLLFGLFDCDYCRHYGADNLPFVAPLRRWSRQRIAPRQVQHRSGPLYLWYEIISPGYLRRRTDQLVHEHVDSTDVVVDSQDEILWRP